MSLDYWNMKLSGVMVKYDGRYETIADIVITDNDLYENYVYPEDALPGLGFYLSTGSTVSYEDFTIDFPSDRWVSGKTTRFSYCYRGSRSLGRNYKMGPCSSNIEVWANRSVMGVNVPNYLNNCLLKPKYHSALEALVWDRKGAPVDSPRLSLDDVLVSKNCAIVADNYYMKSVYYKKLRIAEISQRDGKQRIYFLKHYNGKMPSELVPLQKLDGIKLNIPDKGENLHEYFN